MCTAGYDFAKSPWLGFPGGVDEQRFDFVSETTSLVPGAVDDKELCFETNF